MKVSDLKTHKSEEKVTMDEALHKLNSTIISLTPFEINKLDSIYSSILSEKQILSDYAINVYKHNSDSILETTIRQNIQSKYSFHTIKQELDIVRDVEILFTNPTTLILRKMSLLLIFSSIILFVVVISLIYQFRIIHKQKKIEQIRQDFTDSMIHELRNPLQGALSMTELVENDFFRKIQNVAKK